MLNNLLNMAGDWIGQSRKAQEIGILELLMVL
jgi:hypothetical protein